MGDTQDEKLHQDNVALGILAAIAAFFLFAVMLTLAKVLGARHSPVEVAFYRNIVAIVPFLILIVGLGRREIVRIRSKPRVIVFRAVLGALSLVLTFYAYSLLPMADAAALMFTSSLLVPVLGVILLKEFVGAYRWSAVVFGFIGVVIILRPTGDVFVLGVTVSLAAAAIHAVMQVILRFLGGHERPETVAFYFILIGTAITALPLPFIFVMPTLDELPLIVAMGLSGALAQWMLSVAYTYAPAAVVTVFNYSLIVWVTAFGWFIWGDWPGTAVQVGAAVVIASNLFVIWRESRIGKTVVNERPH